MDPHMDILILSDKTTPSEAYGGTLSRCDRLKVLVGTRKPHGKGAVGSRWVCRKVSR